MRIFFLIGVFFTSFITQANPQNPPEVWVTIFIHGIISVKPHLSIANFIRFMRDKIGDTTYARTVEIIRKDPFFYQYHAMQGLGLQPIDLTVEHPGAASTIFARSYDSLYHYAAGENAAQNYYYTFGWSGLLSARMRCLEAELLYKALLSLLQDFHARSINPKLRIVGYSHGGNVALELATIAELTDYENQPLVIDELVLLGVPVLPNALTLIEHSIFKAIYHIFSVHDRIQNLDCFAINRFFSDRVFRASWHRELPDKLTQIQLNIRRPMITYHDNECIHDKRTKCLMHRSRLRNANPGHSELWSFGWTPSHYRENFPFYPLPAGVLIPFIIEPLKKYKLTGHDLIVEFHPWQECLVIISDCLKEELLLPFISHKDLYDLRMRALAYKPENFNGLIFEQHIQQALEKAHQEKKIESKPKRLYRRSKCQP